VRLRLSPELPDGRDLLVFAGYCLAGAVYVAVGVLWVDFLFSYWVGLAYLLLTAWLVPAVARRLR
jgi:hypothetical protein